MKTKNKHKKSYITAIGIVLLSIAVLIMIYTIMKNDENRNGNQQEEKEKIEIDAGNGLYITGIGSYSGPYMEDASNDEVKDILMVQVTNRGDKTLQYAELTMGNESESALFKVSTINPGQTITALESQRKIYDAAQEYTNASSQYVAFFKEELNIYEGVLRIQPLDGGFNISNVSDEDIEGEIVVYFKDWDGQNPCGGITYRGRLEGGLKDGELKQVMASKFTENNTTVMFITIAEE